MTTDVVLPTQVPEDGVLEDLPGFLASAMELLMSHGCLLINANLDGKRLSVLVDPPDLETLMALVGGMASPIVYVDGRHWTADKLEERRERLTDDDVTPQELADETQALNESEDHLDELSSFTFSVVTGGVVHIFNYRAAWSARTEQSDKVIQGRVDGWVRRHEQEQQERENLNQMLGCLADELVQDEPFLRLTNDGGRRIRAGELAAPLVAALLGSNGMGDQHVRGAIRQAVQVATARRTEEIIPARTAALLDQLPRLADELAADPEFVAATTKPERKRCARDLLARTDPVADPAVLVSRLLSMADATHSVYQPILAT